MLEVGVVLVAVAIGAFIKGATGQGLPQVAIPVMAVFVGVEQAVVVMAIPTVVSNIWLMWQHRGHYSTTRDLPVLLVTGFLGTIVGTWGLTIIDAKRLSLIVGVLVAVYVVFALLPVDAHVPAPASRFSSPPAGLLAGVLQGATGISGPLLSAYLHSFRLHRESYVVSLVTLFQAFATVQVLTLAWLGLYSRGRLLESISALVPIMIILPIGARVGRRLSPKVFEATIVLLLGATAVKLLYDGLGA